MEQIRLVFDDTKESFIFSGKIDSSSTPEIDKYIFDNANAYKEIVFDFTDVIYITSVGLRLCLKAAKIFKNFKIINVSKEVYDIFEMTSFDDIIEIQKQKRIISIKGKEMIGQGCYGKVYRIDPDTIIKVFPLNYDLENINREIQLARKAFLLGVPTAIPFDTVEVEEGGYGCVYELIKSQGFQTIISNNIDNVDTYITQYANVLKNMMNIEVKDDSLPSKRLIYINRVKTFKKFGVLTDSEIDKLIKMVEAMPEKNNFIHGDFHIKNVMMQDDEPILIDMDTIGKGHCLFELCNMFASYLAFPSVDHDNAMSFFGLPYEITKKIFNDTINIIFNNHSPEEIEIIKDKISILGYWQHCDFELNELSASKTDYSYSLKQLKYLLNKYDSLNFEY